MDVLIDLLFTRLKALLAFIHSLSIKRLMQIIRLSMVYYVCTLMSIAALISVTAPIMAQTSPAVTTQVKLSADGQLNYQGIISFKAFQTLLSLYNNAAIKPTTLHINSLGGDGLAGILLGKFIFKHGLKLSISEHCMSSCANFVFTSSSQVTLHPNALIVFHGSFYQENLALKFSKWYELELQQKPHEDLQSGKESTIKVVKDNEKLLSNKYYPLSQKFCSVAGNQQESRHQADDMAEACVGYLRQQESDHFTRVAVDSKISFWGQIGGYKAIYESYQYIGFYYSLDDLKNFGIKNIKIEGGKEWSPYASPYYPKVYQATLKH